MPKVASYRPGPHSASHVGWWGGGNIGNKRIPGTTNFRRGEGGNTPNDTKKKNPPAAYQEESPKQGKESGKEGEKNTGEKLPKGFYVGVD